MAKLEVRYSDGAVTTKALSRERSFVIGSDPSCDLVLTLKDIEPRHVTIRWADRRYRLEAGTNVKNVFVGVSPVQQLRLKPDAEFSIAGVEFRVRYEEDELGAIAPSTEPAAPTNVPLYMSRAFLGIVAGLVVLAGLSVGLYFLVQARAADQQFEKAVTDLKDKLYEESIAGFDRFTSGFPKDPRVDQAIYLRAKARVEGLLAAGGSSLPGALEAAERLVEEAGSTKEYAEHPTETGDLILSIARQLAEQSRDRASAEPLDLSQKGVALLQRALPADRLPTEEMARVATLQEEAKLAVTKGGRIEKTLSEMDARIGDRQPAATYELYRHLIHSYPDLKTDARLRTRLAKATGLERELVRFLPDAPAIQSAPSPDDLPAWTLVRRAGPPTTQTPAKTIPVPCADVLYGIDQATGQVHWRRVMGYTEAWVPTVSVSDPDSLVGFRSDLERLVLLDRATGKEKFAAKIQPFVPHPLVPPQWVDGLLAVVTAPGEQLPARTLSLFRIEKDRVGIVGSIEFPQAISAPPEFDAERRTLLVVGNEATLFTINLDRKQIESVYPLGHEAGAIQLRPVLAGRFLFVVENKGTTQSTLRTFVIKKEDGTLTEVDQQPINGRLSAPPVVRGGRLFWASEQGEVKVFELGAETDAKALVPAASLTDPEASADQAAHLLPLSDSEFFVVSGSMKKYQLAVGRKEISPVASVPLTAPARSALLLEGSVYVQSNEELLGGNYAQQIRADANAPTWTTHVGELPTSLIVPKDAGSALSVDSDRSIEVVAVPEPWTDRIEERPLDVALRLRRSSSPLPTILLEDAEGCASIVEDAIRYVPTSGEPFSLPLLPGVGGKAARLEGGILLPSRSGYVYWLDLATRNERSDPFAAPYKQGSPVPLSAVLPNDPLQATAGVWAAGANELFFLELSAGNRPMWQSTGSVVLPDGISVRELHRARGMIWCVGESSIVVVDPKERKVTGSIDVAVVPSLMEGTLDQLAAIDRQGRLLSFDLTDTSAPKIRWELPLPSASAGRNVCEEGRVTVALADGTLVSYAAEDGSEKEKRSAGRAIARGPWKRGTRWWGIGADGSILAWPDR